MLLLSWPDVSLTLQTAWLHNNSSFGSEIVLLVDTPDFIAFFFWYLIFAGVINTGNTTQLHGCEL